MWSKTVHPTTRMPGSLLGNGLTEDMDVDVDVDVGVDVGVEPRLELDIMHGRIKLGVYAFMRSCIWGM